jgi:hypothetical protein
MFFEAGDFTILEIGREITLQLKEITFISLYLSCKVFVSIILLDDQR